MSGNMQANAARGILNDVGDDATHEIMVELPVLWRLIVHRQPSQDSVIVVNEIGSHNSHHEGRDPAQGRYSDSSVEHCRM
jgi:hypothetical protein